MIKSFKLKLWQKVFLGMLIGMVVGHFLGEDAIIFKPIGTIFINLLKMVVIPLIFFSILNGMATMHDMTTFARIGKRAVLMYSCTTVFAILIGIFFANIFQSGKGVNIPFEHSCNNPKTEAKSILDIIVEIVPSNPIKAMADSNTTQVVAFALFVGVALILIKDRGDNVRNFINSATALVFKMVELVIKLTPYGVFAIMSWVVGTYGFGMIGSLMKFVFSVLVAFGFQYMLFGIMILVFARINPMPFYKKMLNTQVLAFASSSSKATLSTAIETMRDKMGVSKQSASFILPLGAAMNMDGTAIYLGMAAVFFAQVIGIELTYENYLTLILTATIGSIGAAGFPGGGMIMLGTVLSSLGLPLELMSILLGIERILDMSRTVINITGDCTVTLIIDKMEKKLNQKKYYENIS